MKPTREPPPWTLRRGCRTRKTPRMEPRRTRSPGGLRPSGPTGHRRGRKRKETRLRPPLCRWSRRRRPAKSASRTIAFSWTRTVTSLCRWTGSSEAWHSRRTPHRPPPSHGATPAGGSSEECTLLPKRRKRRRAEKRCSEGPAVLPEGCLKASENQPWVNCPFSQAQ